jgi:predicted acyltransferase
METPAPKSERLLSLDALRGFDLFWIVGGHGILVALFKLTEWGWLGAIDAQLKHVDWNGFQAYDLIFPLFLFMAGVSTPYSLTRRLTEGARSEVIRKVIQRGLILVLLGIIYNNGLQWKGLENMRFGSVLGRIGLAGMFAQLIFAFNFEAPKRLWYWLAGILPCAGFRGWRPDDGRELRQLRRPTAPAGEAPQRHPRSGRLARGPASHRQRTTRYPGGTLAPPLRGRSLG